MSQFANFENLCSELESKLSKPKNNKITRDAFMVFEAFCNMKCLSHFRQAFQDPSSDDADIDWFIGDRYPKLYEELLTYRINPKGYGNV